MNTREKKSHSYTHVRKKKQQQTNTTNHMRIGLFDKTDVNMNMTFNNNKIGT